MSSLSESELVEVLEGRKKLTLVDASVVSQVQSVAQFLGYLEKEASEFTTIDIITLDLAENVAVLKFGFEWQGSKFPSCTLSLFLGDENLETRGIEYDGSPLGIYFGRKVCFVKQMSSMALTALTSQLEKDLKFNPP